jgi:hypothetical protein
MDDIGYIWPLWQKMGKLSSSPFSARAETRLLSQGLRPSSWMFGSPASAARGVWRSSIITGALAHIICTVDCGLITSISWNLDRIKRRHVPTWEKA